MSQSTSTRRRFGPPLLHFGAGRRGPVLLLALSLAVTLGAIVQAQHAVRSHRATADRLVEKYGAWAAWSYRQHTAELLHRAVHASLAPVFHAADRREPLPPLDALLEHERAAARHPGGGPGYGAPFYFRSSLDGAPVEVAGEAPDPAFRAWIAATLRADAPALRRTNSGFGLLSARVGGVPRHLVYAIVRDPAGREAAYGYELDPARYRPLFQHVVDEQALIPSATLEGRRTQEVLTVRVVAPGVGELFASDPGPEPRLAGAEPLGPPFGSLAVRAAVRPEAAGLLIIGGLPRSRLPLLIGMLILSAGLAAVAVGQLRREAELARMRSDFVSSVSHELRTPLAQVRLFMETLRLGRWRTDTQREWLLDNVDRETTRLTNLVDNVLHFSRGERGAARAELQVVELRPYLEGIAASFAPLAASRGARLEVAVEAGLVARLDPEAFRQVVLNLLDNAVKYGPRGQVVRVSAAPCGDGRVALAVEDEGPGIEPADRERVWEPFRRGERAIGSAAAGSGIGLSVVREIAGWHGGTSRVEDGARGARIVVELPGWAAAPRPAAHDGESASHAAA
ncbi:MAG: HAMP domain-containing histidine kinase [Gemmatimonadetes bacterium]|nr:HAMP domain-containing histidine kinase [Gemmatimonadota bacterium]